MKWNNCLLLFDKKSGKFTNQTEYLSNQSFRRFFDQRNNDFKENVWFDLEDGTYFGLDQTWLNTNSRNSFFISDRERFLSGNKWDRNYVLNYYGSFFGANTIENQEIIYNNPAAIEKFKNSKILIIGGGPTTSLSNWDPYDYEHVWSCNHFFLNERLKNIEMSMITMTDEVDYSPSNEKLHSYLKDKSTLICFEDRMSAENQKYFRYMQEKYSNRCIYAHTRYRGKIGSAPRLICMAVMMGVDEIHIVGMDGIKKDQKLGSMQDHSFEKNKKIQGTVNYNLYRRHYVALWDYILNDIGEDVKFVNLGEGYSGNMTTDISKQMFPLEDK